MLNNRQTLGKQGEEIAENYLKKNKYKILEKNYKNRYGEIDIIAQKNKKIIFIEVKTRYNLKFGPPEESVNITKQIKIIRSAEKYILSNKLKKDYRIDVIAIKIKKDKFYQKIQLKHLKSAIKYF